MAFRDVLDRPSGEFTDVYVHLLQQLLHPSTPEETNARTKTGIKAIPGGASFKLDLSTWRVPVCGVRRLFPKSAAAEIAWYIRGRRDLAWIRQYAPLWDKFGEPAGVDADIVRGETPETEVVKACYGYRWRRRFGRDQLRGALDALGHDSTNRRVYVDAWDATEDGLTSKGQKNVPCPVGFTLSLLDGRLHSSLLLRSSDVFVGLPYDVMGHAMLMAVAACSLGTDLGTLHVTLAHAHLYEKHYEMAREALRQDWVEDKPTLLDWTLSKVEQFPEGFVKAYAEEAKRVQWPSYSPRPEVIE